MDEWYGQDTDSFFHEERKERNVQKGRVKWMSVSDEYLRDKMPPLLYGQWIAQEGVISNHKEWTGL